MHNTLRVDTAAGSVNNICGIFIFLLTIILYSPGLMADDHRNIFDPDSPLAGMPTKISVEDVSFIIPRGYLHRISRGYDNMHTMYLWMLWPNLVPQQDSNVDAFGVPGGGAEITVGIGIFQSPEFRSSFLWKQAHPEHIRTSRSDWSPSDFDQLLQGKETYGLQVRYVDIDKVISWLSQNNVRKINDFVKSRWDDLFYRNDQFGELSTIIKCSTRDVPDPEEEKINGKDIIPVPHCNHQFKIDEINAHVIVNYRRIYLPDWKEIEEGVRYLLIKFYNQAKKK